MRESFSAGPMPFQTKADMAYSMLRGRIMNGSLAPGTSLKQEQLAAEIGVSTTPLREAITRLEAEGLVSSSAHHEVTVSTVDLDDLIAVYEVKEHLDALAASLAAVRRTDDEAREIEETAQLLSPDSGGDLLRANREFHAMIYRASHNPVLIELLDDLWDRSDRHRRLISDLAREPVVAGEHRDLAHAVREGDSRRAASLMRGHVRSARKRAERKEQALRPTAG